MTLSTPIKILVGVLTLVVMLLPVGLFLLWGLMVSQVMRGPSSDFPSQFFDIVFPVAFFVMCLFTLIMYGLTAFYVTHAIKNERASDLIRILALLAVFFLPYLGMPFYYILYILIPHTPAWALKATPAT